SAIATLPMPMEPPPRPKGMPPPPPESRRSSTLSLSRWPSHFIATPLSPRTARGVPGSRLRQRDPGLPLVLPAAVLVAGLADLVALEEQHLRAALAGVDLRRQRRRVAELERHV